jgi:hypothetical protein
MGRPRIQVSLTNKLGQLAHKQAYLRTDRTCLRGNTGALLEGQAVRG